jgi:predicted CXXCH cytochrome family protein
MPDRPVALVLLLAATVLAQNTSEGPRILRPSDKAALPPGPLTIIARGAGSLLLDGKGVSAKALNGGMVFAEVTPRGGLHELSFAGHKLRFFVGPGAPADFRPYRIHPPAGAACETCHVVREGAWEFRGAGSSCFGCHDQKKFPVGHTHNAEVLSECGLCHDPHGSAEKFHLKLAKETACKQCHG